ncbi:hypothetical protein MMC30_007805 [Trapelia coarctata]|nr:hypothetical protein [Trapelia coarctata]
MEFQYSDIVDPSTYETDVLFGDIPLRRHKDPMKENIGIMRAHADWNKFVGPLGNYKGGLGSKYSFVQVNVPECLPDRLEIISYACEFGFLCDDVIETVLPDQKNGGHHQLLNASENGSPKPGSESTDRGVKQMRLHLLSEMAAIDQEGALSAMGAFATFTKLASSLPRSTPFMTLEEYIPWRVIDVGELVMFGIITFGMALTIHEDEMDQCRRLTKSAFAALSLTNDLHSWDRDRETSKRAGLEHVQNGVWVLMKEHSITEAEAKSLCRVKIAEYIADHQRTVEEIKGDDKISVDLRRYVEAILYCHSGNAVWSIYCPRYHPEAS